MLCDTELKAISTRVIFEPPNWLGRWQAGQTTNKPRPGGKSIRCIVFSGNHIGWNCSVVQCTPVITVEVTNAARSLYRRPGIGHQNAPRSY